MNKWLVICPLVVITSLAVVVALGGFNNRRYLAAYHLREFEHIKTNFNNYKPSISEQMMGVGDNKAKWDYHLGKLEELGVVAHQIFVFTNRPYTKESVRQIWRSANSNFPNAVMFTAKYYDTNFTAPWPGWNLDLSVWEGSIILEVWDFPSNMPRWGSFYWTNN
jgi:protein involved in ribonucleotide reduction